MIFREAIIQDIPPIQWVRNSVKENILSDPSLVTDTDCEVFLTQRGKGWVCEADQQIVGFAIIDMQERNIWALFVHPDFEKKGIGKKLHSMMLKWYFDQHSHKLWLGTEPGTRAEIFYQKQGWKAIGVHGKGEIKFEMSREDFSP